ncbi:hypothetical protein ACFFX0_30420 [Citricoccus parietis]|uniref:Uncharacterized protein n=1 Tax=Citricoccus parietis TaxID=592307 RepID=A0ABV5G8I9_9MICC
MPAAPPARKRDAFRLAWWLTNGLLYGARNNHRLRARVLSGAGFGLVLACWPVLCAPALACLVQLTRRNARYYMTPQRDAVLGIAATPQGWRVEDHASSKPGGRRGAPLRTLVLADLIEAADSQGIAIYATAADDSLAEAYRTELPDMVIAGKGWPRGTKLYRAPSSTG